MKTKLFRHPFLTLGLVLLFACVFTCINPFTDSSSSVGGERASKAEWVKYWGGPYTDVANDVAVDQNGNIYVSGWSASSSEEKSRDFLLLKYDAAGTLLWTQKFDYGLNLRDQGCRLDIDQFGNVYIAGRSDYKEGLCDAVLVKCSPNGTQIWFKKFNYPLGTSAVYDVVVDKKNNWVYTTGWGHEGLPTNAIILKYDYNGNLIKWADWSRAKNLREYFKEAVLDDSGNICVAGFYEKTAGAGYYYALLKYDSNLNLQWPVLSDSRGYYNGITRDKQGNIYASGCSESGAYRQMIIHKYGASGNLIWERSWGGTLHDDTWGITVGEDGYLYMAGSTEITTEIYDAVLLKYDLDGNLQWAKKWGGSNDDRGNGVFVNSYGIHFCGNTKSYGNGQEYDVFLIKTRGLDSWYDVSMVIDLVNDRVCLPEEYKPFVNFILAPTNHKTVLKLTLGPNNYRKAFFEVEYGKAPYRWSVNIGDSDCNDGGGGDCGHFSNDAEMQIGGGSSNTTLYVNGRDGCGLLAEEPNFVQEGAAVFLNVSDSYLGRAKKCDTENPRELYASCLYALNGQPDTEGPVNYDVYAAFNRVIGRASRSGDGVTKVNIVLLTGSETTVHCEKPGPSNILVFLRNEPLPVGKSWLMEFDVCNETVTNIPNLVWQQVGNHVTVWGKTVPGPEFLIEGITKVPHHFTLDGKTLTQE